MPPPDVKERKYTYPQKTLGVEPEATYHTLHTFLRLHVYIRHHTISVYHSKKKMVC